MSRDTRIGLASLTLGLFTIAAFYLWPDKKWIGFVSLVCFLSLLLFWAALEIYGLWNKRPSESTGATPDTDNVSATDWKNLAKDFQALPGRIRGGWEHQKDCPDAWEVPHPECAALCALAGAMLIKSPKILADLSQELRSETNAMFRWLGYLRQKVPVTNILQVYESRPDEEQKLVLHGSLENVAGISYRACMECAAAEI
jgi:hypothetical protein